MGYKGLIKTALLHDFSNQTTKFLLNLTRTKNPKLANTIKQEDLLMQYHIKLTCAIPLTPYPEFTKPYKKKMLHDFGHLKGQLLATTMWQRRLVIWKTSFIFHAKTLDTHAQNQEISFSE